MDRREAKGERKRRELQREAGSGEDQDLIRVSAVSSIWRRRKRKRQRAAREERAEEKRRNVPPNAEGKKMRALSRRVTHSRHAAAREGNPRCRAGG